MSQYVESPTRTFEAGGAIGQHLRVKMSSGKLAAAGATEQSIGTIETQSFASGDMRAVRLKTAQGTRMMVASGAVSLHANVYGDASGKVTATANSNLEGIALTAATADGDFIEVLTLESADTGLIVAGLAAGYKLARGVSSVTGSGTVVTGLATVVAVVATAATDPDGTNLAEVSATIGDQAGAPAAGSVILKAWKITAADNGALIAATAAKSINWVAIGT